MARFLLLYHVLINNKSQYNDNKFSLYIHSTDPDYMSIVNLTSLGDYNDFTTHPFEWWVKTLRPFIKKEVIDNSKSCNNSWLDKQLKELIHGR